MIWPQSGVCPKKVAMPTVSGRASVSSHSPQMSPPKETERRRSFPASRTPQEPHAVREGAKPSAAKKRRRFSRTAAGSSSTRAQWKERQQADQQQRQSLEARQMELQTRFGERRRARDIAEAQLAARRQALQQRQWDLQRTAEELQSLAEQQRSDLFDHTDPVAARGGQDELSPHAPSFAEPRHRSIVPRMVSTHSDRARGN